MKPYELYCYVKIHWPFLNSKWASSQHNFVNSYPGHLENISLLNYAGLPDVQTGFRKGRSRDQIVNICWIIEKAREFQKKSTSASLTMLKPLTV